MKEESDEKDTIHVLAEIVERCRKLEEELEGLVGRECVGSEGA